MTTLELGSGPAPPQYRPRAQRINWTAIGVVTAIALAFLSWLGSGAQDYRHLGDRVTVLETNRQNDVDRMKRIERSIERMDEKLDVLLQREAK